MTDTSLTPSALPLESAAIGILPTPVCSELVKEAGDKLVLDLGMMGEIMPRFRDKFA